MKNILIENFEEDYTKSENEIKKYGKQKKHKKKIIYKYIKYISLVVFCCILLLLCFLFSKIDILKGQLTQIKIEKNVKEKNLLDENIKLKNEKYQLTKANYNNELNNSYNDLNNTIDDLLEENEILEDLNGDLINKIKNKLKNEKEINEDLRDENEEINKFKRMIQKD